MFLGVMVYDDRENDNEFHKNSCLSKNQPTTPR